MDEGKTKTPAGRHKRRLIMVLGLTATYVVVEVIGAFLSGSLALLADSGFMLSDVAGLALSLFAVKFAERSATPERTYGYYRVEILAALINAVALIFISIYIFYAAYLRFLDPPAVASRGMFLVAVVGLGVNATGVLILRRASEDSLNIKGAYYEVLSDMISSVGVIAASVVMWTTGWYYADPLISVAIGIFILPRTWVLLRDAVGVLLEGTPSGVNLTALRESIAGLTGVAGVHDLHVWALTSGVNAMSVHVVSADGMSHGEVLADIHRVVREEFQISHVTVQVEDKNFSEAETHL